MNELYELLNNIQSWHWIILAIALLSIDALLTGGFFLGVAAAALVMWITKLLFADMGWQSQLVIFSILSLIFSILYNKVFKEFNETTDVVNINNRAAQMIGKEIVIDEDLEIGQSRIQIGDTFWKITTKEKHLAGEKITITGSKGMELFV